MKNLFLSITLALACWSNTMIAEIHEHEYVPLLEDGRQWIYSFRDGTLDMENGVVITTRGFYKLYFQGDTVIDGKNYLKCYYNSLGSKYYSESEDHPIAYMREEGKSVYAIYTTFHSELMNDLLYDFEDMNNAFFEDPDYPFFEDVNDVILAGKWRRVFKNDGIEIIEGIGPDGHGDLLFPVLPYTTCECDFPFVDGLAMMLDKDDNIIYKGSSYAEYLESKPAGDVNGDGKVNVSDITALINIILGVK